MADHRKLGLCYNCNEPYVHDHKCPYLYLEVTDYIVEEPNDDVPKDTTTATTAEAMTFDPDTPMISLSMITGIRTEDTMQLRIQVGAQEFMTLLDLRSTHNFISSSTARRARL